MFEFLRKVYALARPYRGRLLMGVITGVISGLLEPLMIVTVGFVYGVIFPSVNSVPMSVRLKVAPDFVRQWADAAQQSITAGVATHPGAILVLAAMVPAVFFLRSFFSYLNVYFLQWAAIRAVTDLRIRLFRHLMEMPLRFFNRNSTGELISRISNDTSQLQNILSSATTVMFKDPVMLVSLAAIVLLKQPRLTFISLIVMPVSMIPILIYSRKVRRSSRELQNHYAELSNVMSETFTGVRVIKAYNLESRVVEMFHETARRFIGHYMRIVRSSEIPGPLLEFVGALGVALVLLFLAYHGGTRPTSEQFIVFLAALFAMYRPLKNLTRLQNNLEQARAASQRVFELLATHSDLPEAPNPKPLQAAGAPIHFDAVEFSYGDKPVLHGFTLTVKPGSLVALVGPSGSGKTTVTMLLLRFYDPVRGSVRIGDTDLREVATRDLRNQIAVVTQETILFNETIERNIELGRPGASKEQITEVARHANAYDFIMKKNDGFGAVVGEKGINLSGGERQRIAISRALLRDAPILILDEATSALDTEAERAVQAALEELMQGRTTICIAHRLSTVQKADLIVVMDEGRIVETGTHAQLIEARGLYRKLYELQFHNGDDD